MCSKEEESSKKIFEGQSNPPTVAEQVEIKFFKAELNLLHQKKCELSKWFYLSSMNTGTASAISPIYTAENFWHGSDEKSTRTKKIGSAWIDLVV